MRGRGDERGRKETQQNQQSNMSENEESPGVWEALSWVKRSMNMVYPSPPKNSNWGNKQRINLKT